MTDRAPPTPADALADLTWLNVSDIVNAFGLGQGTPLRALAELAAWLPSRRFAHQLLRLDSMVGTRGLHAGSAWMCDQLSGGATVRGAPPPADGPLLVVANHPGLLDTMALFTAIPRADLRILAVTRPFLRALPNIASHLFSVGATATTRMAAVRTAVRHLRAGGALLTFPAGRIEPDPISVGGAEASLESWSESIDLIVRLAGEIVVLPAIVGGVLTPAALHHPLTRLQHTPEDQRWLAAIIQLLLPQLRRGVVRVQLGRPISTAGSPISPVVVAETRRLIAAVAEP